MLTPTDSGPRCQSNEDGMRLARRLDAVKPSATIAISQRAAELKAQGVDVISFGVGEPDFGTPSHIGQAAQSAIQEGHTHYTRVRGIDPLVNAIAADCQRKRGVRPEAAEIVVSVGAKHSLFNLALALYEEGDEVIIPAPYWVSYPDQVRLAGATPVIVDTAEDAGFRLTPTSLASAVTARTKAVLLCTPSNPTGAAYSADQLRALADELRKGDYSIIVDEIYSELVYGGFEQKSLLEVASDLRERIVIVDGVSKTYAMTGWRIGWMIGPAPLAKACEKIQGQATTNPASISQYAAIAALTGPREPIDTMQQAFAKRRTLLVDGLNAIDGISCRLPEGAFYAFPNVSALLGRCAKGVELEDDVALARFFLDEARCAAVPGSAFGKPGYLRFSYATSETLIEEGLHRISSAVAALD